jgi:DNA polymerase-3 subunit beta
MKFTCQKEALLKHVQHVSRVVTVRSNLPILSNLLLETDKKILRISSTDLEVAVTTYIPAEIAQEGSFTVPAKLFQEFVGQNPDEEITFHLESFELVCKSKRVEARVTGMDPEEYPQLPQVTEGTRVKFEVGKFVEVMKQVVIACATDPSRPVLTGVYLNLEGDTATIVATDSFRLVERKITILPVPETITILIPARTIQEIIRISATVPVNSDLELQVNEQQILFRLQDVELYSRLLVGSFPKYQAIIPTTATTIADVTTAEFVQALRLSYVFSQSGIANVLLEIDDQGEMSLSSHSTQRGKSKHVIYAILKEGYSPVRVAFNAKFLLDACTAAAVPYVQLRFSGVTAPLVIATEDPHYTQLVMPIRLDV